MHGGGSSGAVSQVQVDDGIELLRVCSPLLPVEHTAEPANGIAVAAVQLLLRLLRLRLLLVRLMLLQVLLLRVLLLRVLLLLLLLLLCLPEPSVLRWRRRRLEPREHASFPNQKRERQESSRSLSSPHGFHAYRSASSRCRHNPKACPLWFPLLRNFLR